MTPHQSANVAERRPYCALGVCNLHSGPGSDCSCLRHPGFRRGAWIQISLYLGPESPHAAPCRRACIITCCLVHMCLQTVPRACPCPQRTSSSATGPHYSRHPSPGMTTTCTTPAARQAGPRGCCSATGSSCCTPSEPLGVRAVCMVLVGMEGTLPTFLVYTSSSRVFRVFSCSELGFFRDDH